MVTVRDATVADQEPLLWLCQQAQEELVAQRGGEDYLASVLPSDAASIEALLVDPLATVLVGEIEFETVAFALLRIEGVCAELSILYSAIPARGIGVGTALLDEVHRRVAAAGATRLDSYALPGDRMTKNFFESHSMKSRLLVVSTPIGANA